MRAGNEEVVDGVWSAAVAKWLLGQITVDAENYGYAPIDDLIGGLP